VIGLRRRHAATTGARAELEGLFHELDSPQTVANALTGHEQIWWRCCQESLRHDPEWLLGGDAARVLDFIRSKITSRSGQPSADAATLTLVVARALAGSSDTTPVQDVVDRLSSANVLPPTPIGAELLGPAGRDIPDEAMRRRLYALIEALPGAVDDPARAMVALTALLLAVDHPKEYSPTWISAVFGRPGGEATEEGAAGRLELRELAGGPPGIFPDPRVMAGVRAGPSFLDALTTAWNTSPGQRGGRCVLWRLTLDDGPVPSVEGPSLGAAFALGLRELLRRPVSSRPSRAWIGLLLHRYSSGPRPKTAITGDIDERDRLRAIGHIEEKFAAAHSKGWRLVAPDGNQSALGSAPDPRSVAFAENLEQASKYLRRLRRDRIMGTVAAVTTLSLVLYGVYAFSSSAGTKQHTADRLANLSKSLLGSDVRLAQLFAVQAYRAVPDSQTKSALFNAVTTSPHLVRYLQAGDRISVVASSPDGRVALAGAENGTVYRWDLASGRRTTMLRLSGAVTTISADATADAVVVLAGKTAKLWETGGHVSDLQMPDDQEPTAVGISPSGRFVAVGTSDAAGGLDTPSKLVLLDRTTHESVSTTLSGTTVGIGTIAMPDDTQIVTFESGYGEWQRRSLPGLAQLAGAVAGFGTANYAAALSPGGRYFSYSNNGESLPLWTTDTTPSSPDKPNKTVPTRGSRATALAISTDGTRIAQASDDAVYVTDTRSSEAASTVPIALTGIPDVTNGGLVFAGDHDHLLSASGNWLTLWNLGQYARVADTTPIATPLACEACSDPLVTPQPGGQGVAVVDGNGESFNVSFPGSPDLSLPSDLFEQRYGSPVWTRDGRRLIVISPHDDSAEVRLPAPGLPIVEQWPAPDGADTAVEDPIAYAQLSPDGLRLVEIKTSGLVEIRNARNGEVERTLPGPRDLAPSDGGSNLTPPARAVLDGKGEHAAIIDDVADTAPTVVVTDIGSGTTRTVPGPKVTGIAFIGEHFLIQRANGDLEVRDLSGARLQRTLDGDVENIMGPIINGTEILAEERTDGTATIIDFPTGDTLGRITLPMAYKFAKTGMAFTADGRTLVTVTESRGEDSPGEGATGQLVRWRFTPKEWLKAACLSAGRPLTSAEWRQYMGSSSEPDLACES
jgi:WD40 repeat protein